MKILKILFIIIFSILLIHYILNNIIEKEEFINIGKNIKNINYYYNKNKRNIRNIIKKVI
jgi:hypothetical protein